MDITAEWEDTLRPGRRLPYFFYDTVFVQSLAEFDMILHLSNLIFDPCRPLSCYSASATSVISGEFFLHCSGLYFPTGDLAIEETLVTCDKEADVCFGKVAEVVFQRSLFSSSPRWS